MQKRSPSATLYGRESWFLSLYHTLREEQKLKAFKKKVLRGLFGPKREEVIGGWKKLLKKSFIIYTLYKILLGR
jgi:hypothetical protein